MVMMKWRFIGLAIIVLCCALLAYVFDIRQYISLEYLQAKASYFSTFVAMHYVGSLCVYALLSVVMVAFSLPIVGPFTLLGGFLFGALPTLAVASIGVPLGATIAFLCIKYFFADMVAEKFAHKRDIFVAKINKYGASYLLTLNLITVVPFFAISALAALANVPLWTFMWTSAVGTFPMLAVYAFAGRTFADIKSVSDIFSPSLIVAFTLLALLSLIPMFLKRTNKVSDV